MTKDPRYSVLIVGFRSLRFLQDCLDSLFSADGAEGCPPYEILFLDNASPEPEADWVEGRYADPRLRVFRSDKNLLFAGGMNYLAARARGPHIILLNPDARVAPDWLRVLDVWSRTADGDAAQLDLREAAHPERHETQGVQLDRLGFIRHVRKPEAVEPFRIFSGRGAGVLFSRERFLSLGGLDEDMGMYFEETDFFWRFNLAGGKVWFVPGAIVYHVRGGSSSKRGFDWQAYRFTRNRVLGLIKNLGAANLALYLPAHFLIYAARIPMLVVTGRARRAIAEVAALVSAVAMMPRFFSKRAAIAAIRVKSDRDLIREGLLLSPSKPVAWLGKFLGR